MEFATKEQRTDERRATIRPVSSAAVQPTSIMPDAYSGTSGPVDSSLVLPEFNSVSFPGVGVATPVDWE